MLSSIEYFLYSKLFFLLLFKFNIVLTHKSSSNLPIDISFLDGLYYNVHFQVKIIDEEGYTSQGIEDYSDTSDYPIVVSNGQMQNQYYLSHR